jgi:hypothetical protein
MNYFSYGKQRTKNSNVYGGGANRRINSFPLQSSSSTVPCPGQSDPAVNDRF